MKRAVKEKPRNLSAEPTPRSVLLKCVNAGCQAPNGPQRTKCRICGEPVVPLEGPPKAGA